MVIAITSIVVCVLLATLFIVVRARKGACIEGLLSKTLASFAFVMAGAFATIAGVAGENTNCVLIVLALICGLIGDILLELKVVYKNDSSEYLPYGMIAFGFGHILYFAAINFILKDAGMSNVIPMVIAAGTALVLTAVIMFMSKKVMKLDFGEFLPHTLIYTFLLIFVTTFAIVAGFSLPILFVFAGGLLLIFLSDLILSTQYFGGKEDSRLLHILNHSLYYLGQIMIVAFVFCYMLI